MSLHEHRVGIEARDTISTTSRPFASRAKKPKRRGGGATDASARLAPVAHPRVRAETPPASALDMLASTSTRAKMAAPAIREVASGEVASGTQPVIAASSRTSEGSGVNGAAYEVTSSEGSDASSRASPDGPLSAEMTASSASSESVSESDDPRDDDRAASTLSAAAASWELPPPRQHRAHRTDARASRDASTAAPEQPPHGEHEHEQPPRGDPEPPPRSGGAWGARDWSCDACSTMNHGWRAECKRCLASKHRQPPPSSAHSRRGIPKQPAPATTSRGKAFPPPRPLCAGGDRGAYATHFPAMRLVATPSVQSHPPPPAPPLPPFPPPPEAERRRDVGTHESEDGGALGAPSSDEEEEDAFEHEAMKRAETAMTGSLLRVLLPNLGSDATDGGRDRPRAWGEEASGEEDEDLPPLPPSMVGSLATASPPSSPSPPPPGLEPTPRSTSASRASHVPAAADVAADAASARASEVVAAVREHAAAAAAAAAHECLPALRAIVAAERTRANDLVATEMDALRRDVDERVDTIAAAAAAAEDRAASLYAARVAALEDALSSAARRERAHAATVAALEARLAALEVESAKREAPGAAASRGSSNVSGGVCTVSARRHSDDVRPLRRVAVPVVDVSDAEEEATDNPSVSDDPRPPEAPPPRTGFEPGTRRADEPGQPARENGTGATPADRAATPKHEPGSVEEALALIEAEEAERAARKRASGGVKGKKKGAAAGGGGGREAGRDAKGLRMAASEGPASKAATVSGAKVTWADETEPRTDGGAGLARSGRGWRPRRLVKSAPSPRLAAALVGLFGDGRVAME